MNSLLTLPQLPECWGYRLARSSPVFLQPLLQLRLPPKRTELEVPPSVRPAVGGGGGDGENAHGTARGRRGISSLPGSNAFARLSFLWETVHFTKMLRVVSWNINGIRSPLQGLACQEPTNCHTALRRVLDELDADIVCLQETKVTSEPSGIQDLYRVFLWLLTFVPHFAFPFSHT